MNVMYWSANYTIDVGGRQGASSSSVYRRRNSPHFLLLPGNYHRMFTLHAVFCYNIPWGATWTMMYGCFCCPDGDILIVMLGRWSSHSNIATTWPTHHLHLADPNLPAWLSTGCKGVNCPPCYTPLQAVYYTLYCYVTETPPLMHLLLDCSDVPTIYCGYWCVDTDWIIINTQ